MENELALFENASLQVIGKIAALEIQKKALEEEETAMREELKAAMEKYGVKSWKKDNVSIVYKDAYVRTGVDAKKLLMQFPEAYHACEKNSNVKASIAITVK